MVEKWTKARAPGAAVRLTGRPLWVTYRKVTYRRLGVILNFILRSRSPPGDFKPEKEDLCLRNVFGWCVENKL